MNNTTHMRLLLNSAVHNPEKQESLRFCYKCGSLKTYTAKGKYEKQQWYKYGKNFYICNKCYQQVKMQRRVEKLALERGYLLQMQTAI